MSTLRLTVAMTTYNARDHLATALDSVLAQEEDGVEVIAVDDASTDADETLVILERHHGTDCHRNVREAPTDLPVQQGLAGARGDDLLHVVQQQLLLSGADASRARRRRAHGGVRPRQWLPSLADLAWSRAQWQPSR